MGVSINSVFLGGYVGNDAEVKTWDNGDKTVNFNLAVSSTSKDTQWFRIVCNTNQYSKLGDIAQQYIKKGSAVLVEGKINSRKYQDKNTGEQKTIVEIYAKNLHLLDKKEGSQNADVLQQQAPANISNFVNKPAPPRATQGMSNSLMDDDIPF